MDDGFAPITNPIIADRTLIIQNIDNGVVSEDVSAFFSSGGEIEKIQLLNLKHPDGSVDTTKTALVTYRVVGSAVKARQFLNGFMFVGHKLSIGNYSSAESKQIINDHMKAILAARKESAHAEVKLADVVNETVARRATARHQNMLFETRLKLEEDVPQRTVYIGSIPKSISMAQLLIFFENVCKCEIFACRMSEENAPTALYSQVSNHYAFVEFMTVSGAKNALMLNNGYNVGGGRGSFRPDIGGKYGSHGYGGPSSQPGASLCIGNATLRLSQAKSPVTRDRKSVYETITRKIRAYTHPGRLRALGRGLRVIADIAGLSRNWDKMDSSVINYDKEPRWMSSGERRTPGGRTPWQRDSGGMGPMGSAGPMSGGGRPPSRGWNNYPRQGPEYQARYPGNNVAQSPTFQEMPRTYEGRMDRVNRDEVWMERSRRDIPINQVRDNIRPEPQQRAPFPNRAPSARSEREERDNQYYDRQRNPMRTDRDDWRHEGISPGFNNQIAQNYVSQAPQRQPPWQPPRQTQQTQQPQQSQRPRQPQGQQGQQYQQRQQQRPPPPPPSQQQQQQQRQQYDRSPRQTPRPKREPYRR